MVKSRPKAPDTTVSPTLNQLRSQPLPEFLYHYTSNGGMIGIVTGKAVYATHLNYLNDTGEMRHGRKVFWDELTKAHDRLDSDLLKAIVQALGASVEHWSEFAPPYVTSFCADLSLAMYRMYCKPGEGFALAVRSESLKDMAESAYYDFRPCSYDPEEQRDICQELIADFVQKIRTVKLPDGIPDTNKAGYFGNNIQRFVALVFQHVLPLFKDPSFKSEQEWRLIVTSGWGNARFREGLRGITPYTMFHLPELFDEGGFDNFKIVLGPSPTDQDLREKALRLMLKDVQKKAVIKPFPTGYL